MERVPDPTRDAGPAGTGPDVEPSIPLGGGIEGKQYSTNVERATTFLVDRQPTVAAEQIASALGGVVLAHRWLALVGRELDRGRL